MSVELRLPNITAQDERGQITQMKSYLFQMVEQLNWALKTVETVPSTSGTAALETASGGAGQAADPAATFAGIKALIIKSADIVNAYYETINRRLEGAYVAQSTFGTYSEQTAQQITENATAISQVLTNIQQIRVDMEGIESVLVAVNAYINSGLLYYDEAGTPVYGIEVGQRTEVNGAETFNKYARFTANKLSFYDANDNEVAYISDYKLYISNVEITGSYHIGHLLDTVRGDGSIVTTYVGG